MKGQFFWVLEFIGEGFPSAYYWTGHNYETTKVVALARHFPNEQEAMRAMDQYGLQFFMATEHGYLD